MSREDMAFAALLVLALIAWWCWLIRLGRRNRDHQVKQPPRGDDWGGNLFGNDKQPAEDDDHGAR